MGAARLHVNTLYDELSIIDPIYRAALGDSDVRTRHKLRDFALKRWPTADRHVFHLHWIDHISNQPSALRGGRILLRLLLYLVVVRLRRARLVWTVHNLSAHEVKHPRLEAAAYRLVASVVSVIHVPNAATQVALEQRWPRRLVAKVQVIPLPNPFADWPRPDRDEARASLGFHPGESVLLCFGRVRPYKGYDRLAQAVPLISGGVPLRVVLAGDCPDDGLRREIERLAALDERIDLRLRRVDDDEMLRLYVAADWLVLPYRSGDNSGVLCEAFAVGLPAIVSDLPGLMSPANAHPDAIVVAPRDDDLEGLAHAVEQAVGGGRDGQRAASAAAQRVCAEENADLGPRYRRLYDPVDG